MDPLGARRLSPAAAAPYEQLRRGRRPTGVSREQSFADQRRRLIAALVQSVDQHGYAHTSVRGVSALAGVSTRTFYDRFGSKEACFLATYDAVLERAKARMELAYGSFERDFREPLRRAFAAFAGELVEEPAAAKLALLEALGAGPCALARMQQTRLSFARMLSASFGQAGFVLPATVCTGIVCGVERLARQHLQRGHSAELGALGEELATWALRYCSLGAAQLRDEPPPPTTGRPPALTPDSRRARVLRAAAQIAARRGYAKLSTSEIAKVAGVREEQLHELYDDAEQCFLAALSLFACETLQYVSEQAAPSRDPLTASHRAMAALMRCIAENRVLQRVAFEEVFAMGPAAVEHREALLGKFQELLLQSYPPGCRPSEVQMLASVGAIWGVVHDHVTSGTAEQLPALAGALSYLALAPALGGDAASQAIIAAQAEG